jgi:hypothetical protein
MTEAVCFFADVDDKPCDRTIFDRAHLIEKQVMRIKNLPRDVIWDERCSVVACRAHHHRFDHRFIELQRDEIPLDTERFAHEYGLTSYLDRRYGPLTIRCRAQRVSGCHQIEGYSCDEIYGLDGMPEDRTYDPKTMTVVCNACYVDLGCPKFSDLRELESILRG